MQFLRLFQCMHFKFTCVAFYYSCFYIVSSSMTMWFLKYFYWFYIQIIVLPPTLPPEPPTSTTTHLPPTLSKGLPWEVSRTWYIKLGQEQALPCCIRAEQGIENGLWKASLWTRDGSWFTARGPSDRPMYTTVSYMQRVKFGPMHVPQVSD